MLADFIQFCANFIIAMAALRLLQSRTKDTAWGPVFAFLG